MGDWTQPGQNYRIALKGGERDQSTLFEVLETLMDLDIAVEAIEFPLEEGPAINPDDFDYNSVVIPLHPITPNDSTHSSAATYCSAGRCYAPATCAFPHCIRTPNPAV